MTILPDIETFPVLAFERWDWLRCSGVPVQTLLDLFPMREAKGVRALDGVFETSETGSVFIIFEEPEDLVFWCPKTDEIATALNRSFALGEDMIHNSGTFAFEGSLNVFASPLEWLRAGRDGCVILHWERAFDRLRNVPRVVVDEDLVFTYRKNMVVRLPALAVRTTERRVAA